MSERDKKAWQQIKSNPERYAAYLERKRSERALRKGYETTRKRKWRAANSDKAKLQRKAMNAVEVALKNGTKTRPCVCGDCGAVGKVEAHHHKGYAPENWLNVVWLCVFCHRKADAVENGGAWETRRHQVSPKRIQRKRTKGWKMPPNTVYVGRPTQYGNPCKVGDWCIGFSTRQTRESAVRIFRMQATILKNRPAMEALRGKDLACWCPLDQPCHADVLLEIANSGGDTK